MKVNVHLYTTAKVGKFVSITEKYPFNVDMIAHGRVYLDAKSLLGILSCDISKPLTVEIQADEEECSQYLEEIAEFIVR